MPSANAKVISGKELFGMPSRSASVVALLDAASLPGLTARFTSLETHCLFKGKAAKALRDTAPYLIRLIPGEDCCDALLPGIADTIWDREPGILLQTGLALEDLAVHFRRFMRVEIKGEAFFFRFWNPPFALTYFEMITDCPHRGRWFFPRNGGQIDTILVPDNKAGGFRAFRSGPLPESRPWLTLPFRLREDQLSALRTTQRHSSSGKLVKLMKSHFPDLAERMGEPTFDAVAYRALRRSALFGIRHRMNIFRFVAWDLHAQGSFEAVDGSKELSGILTSDLCEEEKMQKLTERLATLSPANLQSGPDEI